MRQHPPNIHQLAATFIIQGLSHLVLGETIQRTEIVLDSNSEVMSSAFMQAHEMQPMLLGPFGSSSTDPSNPPTKVPLAHVMDQFDTNVTSSLFSNRYLCIH